MVLLVRMTKYKVIYSVYTQFWPILSMLHARFQGQHVGSGSVTFES